MNSKTISLQRLSNFAILIFLSVYLLIIAQPILAPVAFGALFAFMIKPICGFYERFIPWRIPSIILAILTVTIPLITILYLFSSQVVDVFQDMPSIREKIYSGFDSLNNWIKNSFGLTQAEAQELFKEQGPRILKGPLSSIQGGLSSSTNVIIGFFLTLIYLFLFLLYRSAFKSFILQQTTDKSQEDAESLLNSIQTIIQKYLYGLMLVIFILGILNSIGLYVIGIDYAVFWGFLAAGLAIIPYVGTFLGGLLPFLYTMATADQSWQPLAVVILFIVVQVIEGNLITPKVVGSSVKVNPLAAILALLAGAQIWGIAGMILSLPAIAVLKEFMKQTDAWKPVGFLLSDELADKEDIFVKRWNSDRFRLRNFFKKKDPPAK